MAPPEIVSPAQRLFLRRRFPLPRRGEQPRPDASRVEAFLFARSLVGDHFHIGAHHVGDSANLGVAP